MGHVNEVHVMHKDWIDFVEQVVKPKKVYSELITLANCKH